MSYINDFGADVWHHPDPRANLNLYRLLGLQNHELTQNQGH